MKIWRKCRIYSKMSIREVNTFLKVCQSISSSFCLEGNNSRHATLQKWKLIEVFFLKNASWLYIKETFPTLAWQFSVILLHFIHPSAWLFSFSVWKKEKETSPHAYRTLTENLILFVSSYYFVPCTNSHALSVSVALFIAQNRCVLKFDLMGRR